MKLPSESVADPLNMITSDIKEDIYIYGINSFISKQELLENDNLNKKSDFNILISEYEAVIHIAYVKNNDTDLIQQEIKLIIKEN